MSPQNLQYLINKDKQRVEWCTIGQKQWLVYTIFEKNVKIAEQNAIRRYGGVQLTFSRLAIVQLDCVMTICCPVQQCCSCFISLGFAQALLLYKKIQNMQL